MDTIRQEMKEAKQHLECARQMLSDEIMNYPTPIAGCDVQFNHLLERHQRVVSALSALARDVRIPTPRNP